jgi:hypothetical protein
MTRFCRHPAEADFHGPAVIPAKAGIHFCFFIPIEANSNWVPAFAGTTGEIDIAG